MTDSEKLGLRIKAAISQSDYSQREIAEKTGISENGLTNYIKGRRTPDAILLYKIAQLCDLSMDYFFIESDEKISKTAKESKSEHTGDLEHNIKNRETYPRLSLEELDIIQKLRQIPGLRPVIEKFLAGQILVKEALRELDNFNPEEP